MFQLKLIYKANQADPVLPLSTVSTFKYDLIVTLMVMTCCNFVENTLVYIVNITNVVTAICCVNTLHG